MKLFDRKMKLQPKKRSGDDVKGNEFKYKWSSWWGY